MNQTSYINDIYSGEDLLVRTTKANIEALVTMLLVFLYISCLDFFGALSRPWVSTSYASAFHKYVQCIQGRN